MKLVDQEYWEKPYRCRTCNIRFETIQEQQHHVQTHRIGKCPMCKKLGMLENHHYSYKDYKKDKTKNTVRMCNVCHTNQQFVRDLNWKGIEVIFIGHLVGVSRSLPKRGKQIRNPTRE